MALKARFLDEAIVEKVQKILNNTDHIDCFHIEITGIRGEAPTINYSITEFISTDREEVGQKATRK